MKNEIIKREFRLLVQQVLTLKGIFLVVFGVGLLAGGFFWDVVIFRLYYFISMAAALHLPVKKILYYVPMDKGGVFQEIKIRILLQCFMIMITHAAVSIPVMLGMGMDLSGYLFCLFYFEFAMLLFIVTTSALPAAYMRYYNICKRREIVMSILTLIILMIHGSISSVEDVYKEGALFFLRNPVFPMLTVFMYVLLVYSVLVSFRWLKGFTAYYMQEWR